jgi:hypothetical protein
MKRLIFLFSIIILAALCFMCLFMNKTPDREKIADKITAITAKEIDKKLGLKCIGTGGGMMYDVESLFMAFVSKKPFEIDSGRKLIVECIQTYLKNVNSSEKIRPFLHNYPFDIRNIKISIHGPSTLEDSKYISLVTIRGKKISYEKDMGEDKLLETLFEETFEEALKIVEAERSPKSSGLPKIQISRS